MLVSVVVGRGPVVGVELDGLVVLGALTQPRPWSVDASE